MARDDDDSRWTEHESFGMMQISRVTGDHTGLFLVGNEQSSFMRIRIHEAKVERKLMQEWPFAGACILEFEMSEAQWAHAISSPNIGMGVPVTLTARSFGKLENLKPPPSSVASRQTISSEIRKMVRKMVGDFSKTIDDLKKVEDASKGANKKALADIRRELERTESVMTSNMGFAVEQAEKALDRQVEEGKREIDSYTMSMMRAVAEEALRKKVYPQEADKFLRQLEHNLDAPRRRSERNDDRPRLVDRSDMGDRNGEDSEDDMAGDHYGETNNR